MEHLQSGMTISPLEALKDFRCFRLAARIDELRKAGHPIKSETAKDQDARYSIYSL